MPERDRGRGAQPPARLQLAPLPIDLLAAPLDYILADHGRHRSVAAALRRFSEAGSASRAEAGMVVTFLERDLGLHHRDEEEDLFPALRRRALPADDLGPLLARLTADHRRATPMIEAIVAELTRQPALGPVRPGPAGREVMMAYARLVQQHLAIENGIVLVIARKRLTREDVAAIGRAMKARRGLAC